MIKPDWYKDAIFYEVHVRSFQDSDGDGVGDFRGLTQRLDYLRDLGINTIWLLPFYPSPLRDDGYDIADYTDIHTLYGKLSEFRMFLKEAHQRGLRVVTELVLNHTSDEHPWFQRARRSAPDSSYRHYYVWSETYRKYQDARVIFKDFEHTNWTWDPEAKAYYWHRFYSHQPDLNYDHPEVRKGMTQVLDFWLGMGVDGLRLDAVPYLYQREGTSCENLPETHGFLKELRRHVDHKFPGRMLLAEANQWPEDAAEYFGSGDECHMAFHFPIMPRMFSAIHMEERFPIVDILNQTPQIPDSCQWALFLRNHDELTLEMVTDSERDYMYRVYARDRQARVNLGIRRRLAPLLGNNRRKIELMNGLLFSLPGTPILYYGDEIGMGDNIYLGDRNGVRTPMQWSGDRNAGFSKANPQRLYLPTIIDPEYHCETLNVEAQQNNPHSLLWWMRRLIALRKRYKAFGRGSIEFINPQNPKILVFVRQFGEERILVAANLSRFVQYVELDLSLYERMIPVEIFGKTPFPPIGELPYFLTMGPHSFYWFSLEKDLRNDPVSVKTEEAIPQLEIQGRWDDLVSQTTRETLEAALPSFLLKRRWFAGRDRRLKSARIKETVDLKQGDFEAKLFFVEAEYVQGQPEVYVLPIAFCEMEESQAMGEDFSPAVIAEVRTRTKDGVFEGFLYDAVYNKKFCQLMLDLVEKRRKIRSEDGEIIASSTRKLRTWLTEEARRDVRLIDAEQSNTSIVFGNKVILKLYRRLEDGRNPDLEISLYLGEHTPFRHIPNLGGYLEYSKDRREPMTLGILQEWILNQGDAWAYTLGEVSDFYERAMTRNSGGEAPELPPADLVALSEGEIPPDAEELLGDFASAVRLLAMRTAQMHEAFAMPTDDVHFSPETFGFLDQRSLYQSVRSSAQRVVEYFRTHHENFSTDTHETLARMPELAERLEQRLNPLLQEKIDARQVRCHGDFHLGQVLYTGKDFYVLDFEGEPERGLEERRVKRSPLRDVAGMIRSFHYAACTGLWDFSQRQEESTETARIPEAWAQYWYRWIAAVFLKAYRQNTEGKDLMPRNPAHTKLLLEVYLLEKGWYEIGYELRHRPEWLKVPLQGIVDLLGDI